MTHVSLFRTKHLIVDVIRVQAGDTLTEILETPATAEQVIRVVIVKFIYLKLGQHTSFANQRPFSFRKMSTCHG